MSLREKTPLGVQGRAGQGQGRAGQGRAEHSGGT